VHAIGPADDVLLDRMTRAALSGCVAAVELPEGTLAEILDRLRGAALWSPLDAVAGRPGGGRPGRSCFSNIAGPRSLLPHG
jgi:hypothetical protein